MKTLLTSSLVVALAVSALGQSTINPTHRHAWGANVGWLDWRVDGAHGAVVGQFVCSGYLWAANAGWIHLGSGAPANGIRYQNTAAAGDYGVNHDGRGNLRGCAWAANLGWIIFEDLGQPRFDLRTGKFSGHAYGANVGWISLSNAFAVVQTDTVAPGADTDGDGIADAYERTWTGSLTVMNATTDHDHDGATDRAESLADTNPLDSADQLRITAIAATDQGAQTDLTWTTQATRQYHLQLRAGLEAGAPWLNSPLGLLSPDPGGTMTRTVSGAPAARAFFRIQAVRPLAP